MSVRLDSLVKKYVIDNFGQELSRSYIEKILTSGAVRFKNEVIKRKGFKFSDDVTYDVLEFDDTSIKKIIDEYNTGVEAVGLADQWSRADMLENIRVNPEKLESIPDIKDDIIFEEDNFLLAYKPPGILSHPSEKGPEEDNMVYRFMKYMKHVHGFMPRAGLLHRLDRPTQGLLLFAKNMRAYNHVKKQFMEKQLLKLYFVKHIIPERVGGIAKNVLKLEKQGRVEEFFQQLESAEKDAKKVFDYIFSLSKVELFGYIAQHRSRKWSRFEENSKRLKNKKFLRIKDAQSIIYPVGVSLNVSKKDSNLPTGEYGVGYTVLQLLTGRTHQIRTQFKYLGIPVYGDYMYGKSKNVDSILGLVAFGLSFYGFEGERQYFVLPRYKWRGI